MYLDKTEFIFTYIGNRIYETFFTFANHPDLFSDMNTITEINRFHVDLQVEPNAWSDMDFNYT